jgi:hypothetical protein
MKIAKIAVSAYQRLDNVDLLVNAPVLFVAGHNEAGKTSLADAVYHVMTGAARRVHLKKNYADLVHDGNKRGIAAVYMNRGGEDYSASVTVPSDKRESDFEIPPIYRLLLDASLFPTMPPDERRKIIFQVGKVKISGKAILEKLRAKGAREEKAVEIGSVLLAGFETAHIEAKAKATEARGAWKAMTNETYGSKKAPEWKAAKPEWGTQEELDKLATQVAEAEAKVGTLQTGKGELDAQRKAWSEQQTRRTSNKLIADGLERARAKLVVDEENLQLATTKLRDTRARAGQGPAPEPLTCPHCAGLVDLKDGKLHQHEAPAQKADPEAIALLPVHEKAFTTCESAVKNTKETIQRAQNAAAVIAEMDAAGLKDVLESDLADANANLASAQQHLSVLRTTLKEKTDAKAKAEAADADTKKALGFHTDVAEWEQIADWLSPSGIQAEIMGEALKPFNDRLTQTATITGWEKVEIDTDMGIHVGGRAYSLKSKSAQWRAQASLVEALASVSGERCFLLDEVDILDSRNRIAFLTWMHQLAASNSIDTAIIMGTFKEAPKCPPTFQVEWIANGNVGEPAQEAQAA